MAWIFQTIGLFAIDMTCLVVLNLFSGSCWLFSVMAGDIKKELAAFNNDIWANVNRAEWKKRFCDIIQIYQDAKQYGWNFV